MVGGAYAGSRDAERERRGNLWETGVGLKDFGSKLGENEGSEGSLVGG